MWQNICYSVERTEKQGNIEAVLESSSLYEVQHHGQSFGAITPPHFSRSRKNVSHFHGLSCSKIHSSHQRLAEMYTCQKRLLKLPLQKDFLFLHLLRTIEMSCMQSHRTSLLISHAKFLKKGLFITSYERLIGMKINQLIKESKKRRLHYAKICYVQRH